MQCNSKTSFQKMTLNKFGFGFFGLGMIWFGLGFIDFESIGLIRFILLSIISLLCIIIGILCFFYKRTLSEWLKKFQTQTNHEHIIIILSLIWGAILLVIILFLLECIWCVLAFLGISVSLNIIVFIDLKCISHYRSLPEKLNLECLESDSNFIIEDEEEEEEKKEAEPLMSENPSRTNEIPEFLEANPSITDEIPELLEETEREETFSTE